MKLDPTSLAMTCLLASMTAIGPLTTDTYVASLPQIGRAFGASTASVQATITCYLIGFATGQVFYGPLSDRFGRRPLVLVGLAAAGPVALRAQDPNLRWVTNEENGKPDLEMAPDALDLLTDYDWPGNVRELENVIERAVVLTPGTRVSADLIPDHVRPAPSFHMPQVVVPPEGISFKDVITDFEKRLIESTLEAAGGVQKRAAEMLHIKPTTLNEMIKRYDIKPKRRKPGEGGDVPPAQAAEPPR